MSLDSGKWYWEATMTAAAVALNLGIITTQYPNADFTGTGVVSFNGARYYCNEAGSYTYNASQPSFGVGDTIGMTFDSTTGEFKFNVNNGSFHTIATKTLDGRSWFPAGNVYASGDQFDFNFGQRPFAYTPPTGFVRLNTYNLPDSTIKKGNTVMDATLYDGNSSTQTVTNAGGFKPDMVWMKARSIAYNNLLHDSVRGVTQLLIPNGTDADQTVTDGITSFNSNGFSLGANGSYNQSTRTYVGWQWQAGQGSTSSNTSGTITSTVSVNTTAGFSVVTYTGTGSLATVGHGLGVAPSMVIVKARGTPAGTARNWFVYHTSAGNTQYLELNTTSSAGANSGFWNNTSPTSTVFTVNTNAGVNYSAATYVAYCWAEIAGFSKFGSYTGNGSADGPFVYTGFRPKFLMFKTTTIIGHWVIVDTSRNTYNVIDNSIYPDTAGSEINTITDVDFLSNGFKWRGVLANETNVNGEVYIYMAFAENPFKNALAR